MLYSNVLRPSVDWPWRARGARCAHVEPEVARLVAVGRLLEQHLDLADLGGLALARAGEINDVADRDAQHAPRLVRHAHRLADVKALVVDVRRRAPLDLALAVLGD